MAAASSPIDRPTLARIPDLHPACNLGAFVAARPVPGDRVAIIDISGAGEIVLTYDDLEAAIRKAVGLFEGLGVTRGTRLAMALPNSHTFLVIFLALMRLGAIPAFLNPRLPLDVLRFVLKDCGATGLLADLAETPALDALAGEMEAGTLIDLSGSGKGRWRAWRALFEAAAPSDHVATMRFEDQAFQPYTAGSTGVPKGIVLTHGGMLWGIEHSEEYWPRRAEERGIVAAPMFHKNAMRGTIKPMLRGGASVVIMRAFKPRLYLEALARHRVTICGGVPAMFADILRETDLVETLDFSALETLSMGSSAVPEELSERLAAAFPGVAIKESYGLTEGGGPTRAHGDGRPTPKGSVGVIAPEYEGKLVDEAGGESATFGELWIRSPYVLTAYAGRPDLTAERLQDGWLKTGDIFRKDGDGFLYFVGRSDDMFSCGGENLYPKDVENLILKLSSVNDVIVVPLPHTTKSFAPAALVAPRPGISLAPVEVQEFCATNGPTFAIPRAVLVVDGLPRTDAGKPDRRAALDILSKTFGTLSPRTERRSRP
ncbi:acyl--CoA ligase [Acuticoccus sp. M5D2P5]|uniref:class I adenylate-forming enzyme family protein n=1 Tax=Acuticoccus kalidii TaxID=2910977 RepID=UPI001F3FB064|nr:class I adenylate-forming enzyme family protein [Acuticoccus kalidii]MCF3934936.1 acyl--CoA ligase [Acuticoccus kalidii]